MARYEEVARSLAQQFESGRYPVGAKLPTEIDLAEEFAVSRATVRTALDTLEASGMISRRRRVGTIVEATRPRTGYARTVSTMNELLQYSVETRREVLECAEVTVGEELATSTGLRAGQQVMHLRLLRYADAAGRAPLCVTDAYLDPEVAARVVPALPEAATLISELIEVRTGILTTRVDQRLRACALDGSSAELLAAPEGAPALEVRRRYFGASGGVHLTTVSTHPGDRFDFTLSMERPAG